MSYAASDNWTASIRLAPVDPNGRKLSEFNRATRVAQGLWALIKNFFSREGFKTGWHEPLLIIGTVAAVFPDTVPDKVRWIPVTIAAIGLGVGSLRALVVKYATLRVSDERDDLRKQLNDLEEQDTERRALFHHAVKVTLGDLCHSLGVRNAHTRATIYIHTGSAFTYFVRFSDNPIQEKVGRSLYPEDEGIIANAWQNVSDYCTDLPGTEPTRSRRILELFDIPIRISKAFRMKSKSLVAVRISDLTDASKGHIGVMVLESLNPRGVTRATRDKVLDDKTWHALQMQMSASRDFLPDASEAQKRGF